MFVVQISDMHVTCEGDAALNLARCVDHVRTMDPAPAAVIASGDLVNDGRRGQYEQLRRLLAPLDVPVYLMPGNHDLRTPLREAFADHRYLSTNRAAIFYSTNVGDLRLIALDTVIENEDHGTLDRAQLEWLKKTLAAAPTRATLIFMHHPPLRTGIAAMDDIALDGASSQALSEVVEQYACIERIACGHVHRSSYARWHGVGISICPSTAFQAHFDLRRDGTFEPSPEAPAYHVHYWNGAELVTHTISVA